MRKIIYTQPDGGLSIVHPVFNTRGEPEDFTEADAEQRAWDKLPADAINPRWVDAADIPEDRTFRNAWVAADKRVTHDMDKVKAIAHTMRRAKRAEEFAPLDEVIAKQIPGKSAEAAEAARSAIRAKYDAVQTSIDAARDVDGVKSALA
jgi:hypothetical protein